MNTLLKNSTINIRPVQHSRLNEVDMSHLPFGKIFSDHMLIARYEGGKWQTPEIMPYGPLALSPSLSALNYGQAVFEGMKAIRGIDGEVKLFRPIDNLNRINRSAHRMCMPAIPEGIFMGGLTELLRLDQNWVPDAEVGSLYIRPVYFAADESVGVKASESYILAIITSPVGPYYAEPVNLLVNRDFARAGVGGTGAAKAAGNYGGAMLPDKMAKAAGYHNILWLDGREQRYIEECGTMNIFFVIDNKVITPSLSGTILEGITRLSLIQLLLDMGYTVEERQVSIYEVQAAYHEGRLQDAFGAGTAATVSHINRIAFAGEDMQLPPVLERTVSNKLKDALQRIKTGEAPDPYGWVVTI
ncbi:MAG: branched-chain amino acid aminotransferase [Bacteroidia bacterium]|nr:branched-chain amino acid aminotransferase [Bacteroidia bacterium]